MKANTRIIKVLVPSVIAVIIITVVSIMIVRGNNKDSSVSENPTTAPAVEEKQTPTYNEPAPTYEEPDYTPPASSGKTNSLINGDDDNSSYGGDPSKSHDSGLKFG